MRVVAADAALFRIGLRRRTRCAGVRVAELDVLMNEVADGLNAAPARLGAAEQLPSQIEQLIAVAEPAGEQKDQRFFGEILDRNLRRVGDDRIGLAGVGDDGVGGDASPFPAAPRCGSTNCRSRRGILRSAPGGLTMMWSGAASPATRVK